MLTQKLLVETLCCHPTKRSSRDFLVMSDPFETYTDEVTKFLSAKRTAPTEETS
jgi:hypothetical protein